MKVNEAILAQLKEDIEGLISLDVPMKKKGTSSLGLCPFHGEKTPSFRVSNTRGIYKCFGCGASGDAIEFVKKYHGKNFKEAVQFIANFKGINIDIDEVFQINHDEAEALLTLQKYQDKLLLGNTNYALNRGLSVSTIKEFGIGLHTNIVTGFTAEELMKCGVLSENGYDLMTNRLTFPFYNRFEQIIGFGGREMGNGKAKYINTRNSILYDKSKYLYNIYKAEPHIKYDGVAVVVEGYFDLITLWQYGVRNVVATCGTSFTEHHCKELIKCGAKEIVFAFDNDKAGMGALQRGIEVCNKVGITPRYVLLAQDPDETVKLVGTDNFIKLIKESRYWKDNRVQKYEDADDLQRSQILLDLKNTIENCKSEGYKIELIKFFSSKLEVSPEYFDKKMSAFSFKYKKSPVSLDFEKKFINLLSTLKGVIFEGQSIVIHFTNQCEHLECFSDEFANVIEALREGDLEVLSDRELIEIEVSEAWEHLLKAYENQVLKCKKAEELSSEKPLSERLLINNKINDLLLCRKN